MIKKKTDFRKKLVKEGIPSFTNAFMYMEFILSEMERIEVPQTETLDYYITVCSEHFGTDKRSILRVCDYFVAKYCIKNNIPKCGFKAFIFNIYYK